MYFFMLGLHHWAGVSLIAASRGPLSSCSVWASHCGVSIVEHGLWSIDSIVVAPVRSYSGAYRIFQDKGSNDSLLHWQANSLPLSHWRSPLFIFLNLQILSQHFLPS